MRSLASHSQPIIDSKTNMKKGISCKTSFLEKKNVLMFISCKRKRSPRCQMFRSTSFVICIDSCYEVKASCQVCWLVIKYD